MKQNITITKISDHGGTEKTPTHAIVLLDEKHQNKKTVGKLWTKTSEYGKYLSGQMQDEFTNNEGRVFDGYVIITKAEYKELTGSDNLGVSLSSEDKAKMEADHINRVNLRTIQLNEANGEVSPDKVPF